MKKYEELEEGRFEEAEREYLSNRDIFREFITLGIKGQASNRRYDVHRPEFMRQDKNPLE